MLPMPPFQLISRLVLVFQPVHPVAKLLSHSVETVILYLKVHPISTSPKRARVVLSKRLQMLETLSSIPMLVVICWFPLLMFELLLVLGLAFLIIVVLGLCPSLVILMSYLKVHPIYIIQMHVAARL